MVKVIQPSKILYFKKLKGLPVGLTKFREQKDKKHIMRRLTSTTFRKTKDVQNIKDEESNVVPSNIKFLSRATKKDFIYNGSFHEAVAPILALAQCFGVMPVKGIRSKSPADLSFSWKNFRTLYSLIILFALIWYSGVVIYWAFSQTIAFKHTEPVIFNISIVVGMYNFILLARKWPRLMQKWEKFEKLLPAYETTKDKSILAHQIKMISFVVLTLSLTEHMLSIISLCHYANYCPSKEDRDPIRNFFRGHLAPLFYFVKYSTWWALIGKLINIYGTFIWSYMDLFVIIVSVGLSSRFKRVNDSLRKFKGKIVPEEFWIEHRTHYRNLCEVCDEIDNAISVITMVSFSNDLYFICIQLLKSLNAMPSFAHGLYFWFSLIFLIGRTLAVSLYSAKIHEESKGPIEILRCVPRESWCAEAKRFSEEVSTDVIALTGMRFFHITRKLVLSVAGTIVTYELVLIQFNENDQIVSVCEMTT